MMLLRARPISITRPGDAPKTLAAVPKFEMAPDQIKPAGGTPAALSPMLQPCMRKARQGGRRTSPFSLPGVKAMSLHHDSLHHDFRRTLLGALAALLLAS